MRFALIFVLASIHTAVAGDSFPTAAGPPVKVLLVGDSWPEFMWLDGTLSSVFAANGRPDLVEKGDVTAIGGSTAAAWAQPDMLQLIADELDANPSIEVVQLTIGGNDFLAGQSGGGWYQGIPDAEKQALLARVGGDLETVIDHILAHDPQVRVLVSLYDYTNFVESLSGPLFFLCNDFWDDMNQPTPAQINEAQLELQAAMTALVQGKPRTHIVDHQGLMQFVFGYPSMSIPPGVLIPPGDLDLPSPPEAMRFQVDCIHLGVSGYEALAQNLWDSFYSDFFCLVFQQFLDAVAAWPGNTDSLSLADSINRLCP